MVFINKCDRTGADPHRVAQQFRDKLDLNAVMLQVPIGLEADLEGVVDLVTMKALYFEGATGEEIRVAEIPAELKEEAEAKREELLDAASMFSEELMEAILEGTPTEGMIREAVRKGTLSLELVPVFMGSAYKNKGVQAMLDAVTEYLPAPKDIKNTALDLNNDENEILLTSDPSAPLISLAFKLEDGRYGQLTYIRIYQGTMKKGDTIINSRDGRKVKVGRLVRMHSDEMEDIEEAAAGDIVALFGIDCASGDTFTSPDISVSMSSMHVPEPVISLAILPVDNKAQANMSKALNRFTKEDPTFRTHVDHETNETIVSGMGELHLEVYIERMKREYEAEVQVGQPQVAYRETITQRAEFNYTHKKQTGGSGQFGRVAGFMEPMDEVEYEFVDKIVGGSIPREFISSCDKGFQKSLGKGQLAGAPITGVRVTINDGASHAVDSSDVAFQLAAVGAFKEGYQKAKSVAVMGSLNQRRGIIIGTVEEANYTSVEAEVPLSEMFGYSTALRSLTQGKAEFTMEFTTYKQVPKSVSEEIIKKFQEEKQKS
jgi:elongation factor G